MSAALDLRCDGVTVRRGGRHILHDVDLAAPAGSSTAIVGPSGSGKTTLLTVLAAVQAPDRGSVHYDGRAVGPATRGPWAGRVQLVHQSFGLLSLLTAAENVELALQGLGGRRRGGRGAIRAAAGAALERVGLSGRARNLVEDLSGGEQQRAALARALVTGPDLLLADEPTAQLDPANREMVTELLLGLSAEGVTVVIATHDAELSARCTAVVELVDGRRPPLSPASAGRGNPPA